MKFFADNKIPFWEMTNANDLVGADMKKARKYCLVKSGELYLVYLASGGSTKLDMGKAKGSFSVQWFNPRKGGKLQTGSVKKVAGGGTVSLGDPPSDKSEDWLVVVRKG